MRDNLNKVVYKAKLLPDIAHCLVPDRAKFVNFFKQKAISDLLEEYTNISYFEVYFETQKASDRELYESVEYFKRADGRYHYNGEFVSRERLENELAQLDAMLTMTAWIKEA